ncbi:TonB-dependent receptor [Spiribacter sp. 221]|uniref:TonB-dependent receptor plug domain-containing protein n=1 Tax=Spiribacter onubensis TaxID=3122420 RepID=UPI00349F2AE9
MKKAFATTALAIAAGVPTYVYAQSSNTTELEPIIVSGGISPVAADEFGRSNTVITRQEIEDRGFVTVQQALEAQPGVSVSGTGPSDRQVRIRGGEANHVLVLVNGVRVAAGDSGYDLRGFDVANVDRIEVLRGPQSVPYGTDAASGVINIITRRATAGVSRGASFEFGEGDRQSAFLTYGAPRGDLSVTIDNLYDKGFDLSGDGGEEDSTSWETVTSKGRLSLTDQIEAGFSFRLADARYHFDSETFLSGDRETTVSKYVFDDKTKTAKLLERSISAFIGFSSPGNVLTSRISTDYIGNQTANSAIGDQTTRIYKYRGQYALDGASTDSSDQLLSLLFESKNDSANNSTDERENRSYALEYQGFMSNDLSTQAGVRLDTSDQFSDAVTWNLAASYHLQRSVRLHSSIGRAVVYPSYFDIYGGTFPAFQPDSKTQIYEATDSVKPEKNFAFDLGLEWTLPGDLGIAALTYYNEELEDEIYSKKISESSDTETYRAENREADSKREGVEISTEFRPAESVDFGLSYTYTRSTNDEGSVEGRRPMHEFGLNTTWRASSVPLTLSGDLRYVRDLYDQQFYKDGDPFAKIPAFTVVNFAARYALTDHIDLTGRITNAFDEDYTEVWGYATRGRAGYIGMAASW